MDPGAEEIKNSVKPPAELVWTDELRERHRLGQASILARAEQAAMRQRKTLLLKKERAMNLSKSDQKKAQFDELVLALESKSKQGTSQLHDDSMSSHTARLLKYNKTNSFPTFSRQYSSVSRTSSRSRSSHLRSRKTESIKVGNVCVPPWAVVSHNNHYVRPTPTHASFVARGVRQRTESVARAVIAVPQVPSRNDVVKSALKRDLTNYCRSVAHVDTEVLHDESVSEAASSNPMFQALISQAINAPYDLICHHPTAITRMARERSALVLRSGSRSGAGRTSTSVSGDSHNDDNDDDDDDAAAHGYVRPASIPKPTQGFAALRAWKASSEAAGNEGGSGGEGGAKASGVMRRRGVYSPSSVASMSSNITPTLKKPARRGAIGARAQEPVGDKLPPRSSPAQPLTSSFAVAAAPSTLTSELVSSSGRIRPATTGAAEPLTHSFGRSIPGMAKAKLLITKNETVRLATRAEARRNKRAVSRGSR